MRREYTLLDSNTITVFTGDSAVITLLRSKVLVPVINVDKIIFDKISVRSSNF